MREIGLVDANQGWSQVAAGWQSSCDSLWLDNFTFKDYHSIRTVQGNEV